MQIKKRETCNVIEKGNKTTYFVNVIKLEI